MNSKTKTSPARTLSLWNLKFPVPPYASWSSTKDSLNVFDPFYTYHSADPLEGVNPGGKWTWQLDVAKNAAGKPAQTPLVPPSKEAEAAFATEHVFEIQIISQFFTFLKVPKATQEELLTKVGTNKRSPIESLAAALPADKEFVYLQSDINGIKMVFFKMGRPTILKKKTATVKSLADAQTNAQEIFRKVTLTALLAAYMNQPPIFRLYNAVRGRIEAGLKAIADSPIATYASTIHPLGLPAAFQKWHQSFIELVELNMQESIDNGLSILKSILSQLQTSKTLGPSTALQTALQTSIKDFEGALQEKGLNKILLRGLMTKLGEAPGDVDLSKLTLAPGNEAKAPWGMENANGASAKGYDRGASVEPQFGDSDEEQEDPEDSTAPGASRDALKGNNPKATKSTPGGKQVAAKTNVRVNPVTTAGRKKP